MATDRLPIPKTIEVTLRRDNEAPQCPDVTRCLLSVEREPNPDLMEVVDSGLPSPLLNRETTVQVLRAEMVPVGLSCRKDYTIKANLISAGGPIAVGEGRIRTISVRTQRVYIPSGSVISDTTSAATEAAPVSAIPGTTTETETINNGDSTQTIITTTTTISRDRWERRLRGCVDIPQMWLPVAPAHLLCGRYAGADGQTASLVTLQDADGVWHVVVERVGGATAVDLVHLTYTPAEDDLYVTAAIGERASSLYVVASKSVGVSRSTDWYWYTYSDGASKWQLHQSGTLTQPHSTPSARKCVVDRDGRVSGHWATQTDTSVESYTADGTCSVPLVLPGEAYILSYIHHIGIEGGFWDLRMGGAWNDGALRVSPQVLKSGDLWPMNESMQSASLVSNRDRYSWDSDVPAGGYSGEWLRWQESEVDLGLHFTLSPGGAETVDYGTRFNLSASSVQGTVVDPETVIAHNETTISFDSFSHEIGSAFVQVTPGGWAMVQENQVESVVDTSTHHLEWDSSAASGWGNSDCPDFYGILEARGIEDHSVSDRRTVWPAALGTTHAIDLSFTAVNPVTDEWYAGALVRQTAESDPTWRIFSPLGEVTAEVATCLGRPMAELQAIYWRA